MLTDLQERVPTECHVLTVAVVAPIRGVKYCLETVGLLRRGWRHMRHCVRRNNPAPAREPEQQPEAERRGVFRRMRGGCKCLAQRRLPRTLRRRRRE